MQSRFGEMMNSSTYCIDVQGRRIIVDVRPSVCVCVCTCTHISFIIWPPSNLHQIYSSIGNEREHPAGTVLMQLLNNNDVFFSANQSDFSYPSARRKE